MEIGIALEGMAHQLPQASSYNATLLYEQAMQSKGQFTPEHDAGKACSKACLCVQNMLPSVVGANALLTPPQMHIPNAVQQCTMQCVAVCDSKVVKTLLFCDLMQFAAHSNVWAVKSHYRECAGITQECRLRSSAIMA